MSKITAIISAYYAEEYLKGRLDNLADQNPRPEIIVVCHENSGEERIAKAWRKRRSDFKEAQIISIADNLKVPTIYKAWNIAIGHVNGEYITNANCDDRHRGGALKHLSQVLDENPDVAVAYSNIAKVSEIGGAPIGQFDWAEGGLPELLHGCFLGPMPMWRKSLHEKHGLFDDEYEVAGDYEFWLRIAAAGEKFKKTSIVLGDYLVRKNSAEHRSEIKAVWETARARMTYRDG